ncbi:hypothetical protein BLNAU_18650 [Blattamonas nauphoetae]|uniref:Uncharacterized protein n=1 Tax=Blattamonas nauphoetae TaxID=2049346 RepID=A0ABQ9X3R0_9EUKA|nr:hypothetical protein BLNAU_18650 [Blattamonas nauphoetae]
MDDTVRLPSPKFEDPLLIAAHVSSVSPEGYPGTRRRKITLASIGHGGSQLQVHSRDLRIVHSNTLPVAFPQ